MNFKKFPITKKWYFISYEYWMYLYIYYIAISVPYHHKLFYMKRKWKNKKNSQKFKVGHPLPQAFQKLELFYYSDV